ncbi:hypothetical protein LTR56_025426 [Elasticomyces elasticus]|nr:hypothetical protein LTR56_025426 [Elasticomyces elasticus]KAK3620921.1 hypothetical protein LTR22_025424 [Elasticomyces elasticus]KAK4904674.1 hypothetical protein LTR49_025920 [Elasticomyces elasticus]KAK5740605.1 hypothetical protein LTS12_024893 [Elasticomyces elasticus]
MGDVMAVDPRQGGYNDGNGMNMQYGFFQPQQQFDTHGHTPILDTDDSQCLDNFFDHPDDPKIAESMSHRADSNYNVSMDDNYMLGGRSASAGTIDPSATMAGAAQAVYGTHPMMMQPPRAQSQGGFPMPPHLHSAPATSEVLNTASSLMDLQQQAAHEIPQAFDHSMAGSSSWGSIGGFGFTAGGAMPSNGGMHMGAGFPPQMQQQMQQGIITPQLTPHMTPQMASHAMMQARAAQEQMQRSGPHMRSNSSTSNYQAFMMQQQMSPGGHQRANMPLARYGSDSNITGRPHGYSSGPPDATYMDKEGNLMHIPLVSQAAQVPRHSNPRAPSMNQQTQRMQNTNNGQSGFRPFNSANSVGSSPTEAFPPSPSTMTPTQQPPTQWGALSLNRRPQYGPQDEDEDTLAESNPRKRRKSHAARDDDGDYQPGARVNTKGGLKLPKKEVVSDEEDFEPATPNNTSTSKKRRRSTIARTISSGSPASAADAASSNGAGSSARRKASGKSRANLTDEQKRQNHIISEQKRRNVIKQSYTDLDNMVPILNGGKTGLSKAEQVKEIVSYINSMVNGNKATVARLQAGSQKKKDNSMNE